MRVFLRAPAKINLGLEILGRRADGYHEIRTILATVSLYDHLLGEAAADTHVNVDRQDLEGEQNLVSVAARLLAADHPQATARFELRKTIPAAAGLGGASSDAAAALIALNRLHTLGLSNTELEDYGARLGSDVPFFIRGGYALASGRGEQLEHFSPPTPINAVIVTPRIAIQAKTKALYESLRQNDFSDGARVEGSAKSYLWLGDERLLVNAFERPLYDLAPSLSDLKPLMRRLGARTVALSGAGPSHYSLEHDDERARALAMRLRESIGLGADVYVCDLIPEGVTFMESVKQP